MLFVGTRIVSSEAALTIKFAAEVSKRGDYMKTVVLNSPGGSVADALAMGRLIRDRNFATEIEPGQYCA